MAFVVLFSTMSFTVNMHYCGGNLVETAIFKKAQGCGMEMENKASEGCSITKKNCCDDKQIVYKGQDELQLTFDKISFEQKIFITAFLHTYNTLFNTVDYEFSTYKTYKPPLVVKQIFKIDETYLI